MLRLIIGVFIAWHGLVHVLYAAHSQRRIAMRPDMAWPDGSWAFSRLLGNERTRLLASIVYTVAGIGFAAGGAGVLLQQDWWRAVVVAAAAFSVVIILLFWDGALQKLSEKGALGILIDLAILAALLILGWPPAVF
jgi:hypothetical protein